MKKRLALTKEGQLTYCSATEENIEKRRCNHIIHQNNNESINDFLKRANLSKIQNNKSFFPS